MNKANFEDWFGRDIEGGWQYLSAIFCMNLHSDIKTHCQSCSNCDDFIIHGQDELPEKLAKMESRLPETTNIFERDQKDFKTLIKYMLFSMPKKSLPIGGNFTKAVRKAINEASGLENIKICAFPTKEQRLVLSSKKAIIMAPWGCGKTWLMFEKAIEFAENGETVVFGIFKIWHLDGEPLILYDMELKFQEFPNVRVKLIPLNLDKENCLKEYTKETKVFFGDEFTDTFSRHNDKFRNETISFLNSLEFSWLTVSNNMATSKEKNADLKEYIESWKPADHNIIELKTPIRSTREIAKHLKENLESN